MGKSFYEQIFGSPTKVKDKNPDAYSRFNDPFEEKEVFSKLGTQPEDTTDTDAPEDAPGWEDGY